MKIEFINATVSFACAPGISKITKLTQHEKSSFLEIRGILQRQRRPMKCSQPTPSWSMRTLKRLSGCFVVPTIVAIMALSTPLRAGQVENPEYKAWASFTVGSSSSLTLKGAGGGGYLRSSGGAFTNQSTLVEVDKDKVMILIGSPSDSNKPRPVSATMNDGIMKQAGEENVSAMGKTFKCKVYETPKITANAADGSGQKSIQTKKWICDDVPGGLVKMEIYRTNPAPDGQEYHNTETHLLCAYEVK